MQRLHYAEWGAGEWLAAIGAALGAKVRSGRRLDIVRHRLAGVVGDRPIHLVNAGRNAIRLALEVFRAKRPSRAQVIVPAYICPSVVDAVQACGLVPVGADIGSDLNIAPASVLGALNDRTLAVIVPHMYGCPARISDIERICRDAGVFLIDDAAQVIGETVDGRPIGTFGDAGLFSFNQSKAVVTGHRGSGAVLLVNDNSLEEEFRAAHARLPAAANWLGPFLHFVWNYQLGPYTGHSGYYFGRLAARLWPRGISKDYYQPAAMGNFWAAIACRQFDRLDAMRAGRIRVASDYQRELAALPEVGFPQFATGRYLSRIVLMMPECAAVAPLRARLAGQGIMTRAAYASPEIVIRNAPIAATHARRLLEVPSHSRMAVSDMRLVCQAIAVCLERPVAIPSS